MIVTPIAHLSSHPHLGALTNTISSAPILEKFNAQWGSTGVVFGQASDPYKERYAKFNAVLDTYLVPVQEEVLALEEAASRPMYTAITSEEGLRDVPEHMQLPILLHKPVRELFEQDKIYGYDYDKKWLPDKDPYETLINNFAGEYSVEDVPAMVVGERSTIDPDITDDDVVAIDETRRFLDGWLEEQLKVGGNRTDPTDIDNKIKK